MTSGPGHSRAETFSRHLHTRSAGSTTRPEVFLLRSHRSRFIIAPKWTDHRGNWSALNKLMTTSAVLMELSAYLERQEQGTRRRRHYFIRPTAPDQDQPRGDQVGAVEMLSSASQSFKGTCWRSPSEPFAEAPEAQAGKETHIQKRHRPDFGLRLFFIDCCNCCPLLSSSVSSGRVQLNSEDACARSWW